MTLVPAYQLPLFPEKWCPKCERLRSLDAFPRDRNRPDGHRGCCKECHCAEVRQSTLRHYDEVRARQKAHYAEHREEIRARKRPREAEYGRRYRAKHADGYKQHLKERYQRRKEAVRVWVKAHPERVKQYSRRDYDKNKDRFNAHVHRRRARLARTEGHFSRADLRAIHAAQSGCCYYCGVPLVAPIHIDHKTPISRGGSNWPDNLALTCEHCNLSKGAKTEPEFRALLA